MVTAWLDVELHNNSPGDEPGQKKRGPAVAGPQDRILHSVCVHKYNIIYIVYLQ